MSCRAHGAAADFRTSMTRSTPLYGKLASGAPPLDSHHHPQTGPHWTKVTVRERPKSGKGMVSKPVSEPSIPSGMWLRIRLKTSTLARAGPVLFITLPSGGDLSTTSSHPPSSAKNHHLSKNPPCFQCRPRPDCQRQVSSLASMNQYAATFHFKNHESIERQF